MRPEMDGNYRRIIRTETAPGPLPDIGFAFVYRGTASPERRGQACKVLNRANGFHVLIQFEDGYQLVCSKGCVRRPL